MKWGLVIHSTRIYVSSVLDQQRANVRPPKKRGVVKW